MHMHMHMLMLMLMLMLMNMNMHMIDRRSYTYIGVFLEPTRVLGESAGLSSDYCSVVHNDATDTMLTSAVSGKCGRQGLWINVSTPICTKWQVLRHTNRC